MLGAHLEDLQQCRSDIVFGIQPRKRIVGMEWGLPNKTAIVLQLHLEQRVLEMDEYHAVVIRSEM